MKNKLLSLLVIGILVGWWPSDLNAAEPLNVGATAPAFTLQTLADKSVSLGELTAQGRVVVVVLRGWPGYQCPVCEVQVHDFIKAATDFKSAKARVIFVYPGPADELKAHAKEFLGNADWPKDFTFVLDPNYSLVNAYGLRWAAPGETAYPSTFVLDQKGVVSFAKVSKGHGGRSKSAEVLKALKEMPE